MSIYNFVFVDINFINLVEVSCNKEKDSVYINKHSFNCYVQSFLVLSDTFVNSNLPSKNQNSHVFVYSIDQQSNIHHIDKEVVEVG